MAIAMRLIDFAQIKTCRIHPGIGIARVGNSADAYFIGPELPCDPRKIAAPDGAYKDTNGLVKRQAARFRIYGYDEAGKNLGEIPTLGPDDSSGALKANVQWKVHLANKKGAWRNCTGRSQNVDHAPLRNIHSILGRSPDDRKPDDRSELIVDPGPRSITSQGLSENRTFDTGRFLGAEVVLGELQTDSQGHLLVLGGFGVAGSTKSDNPIGAEPDDADFSTSNDHWYDDISDGPVTASVTLPGADDRDRRSQGCRVGRRRAPEICPGDTTARDAVRRRPGGRNRCKLDSRSPRSELP